eukprot:366079-Chlamydomonas_euryale.AAC.6
MNKDVLLWDASEMAIGAGALLSGAGGGGARPLSTLSGMTAGVYDVAFTADGTQVCGECGQCGD